MAWLRKILVRNVGALVEHHLAAQKRDVRKEVSLDAIAPAFDQSTCRLGRFWPRPFNRRAITRIVRESGDRGGSSGEIPSQYRDVLVFRHLEELSFDRSASIERHRGRQRMLWMRAIDRLRIHSPSRACRERSALVTDDAACGDRDERFDPQLAEFLNVFDGTRKGGCQSRTVLRPPSGSRGRTGRPVPSMDRSAVSGQAARWGRRGEPADAHPAGRLSHRGRDWPWRNGDRLRSGANHSHGACAEGLPFASMLDERQLRDSRTRPWPRPNCTMPISCRFCGGLRPRAALLRHAADRGANARTEDSGVAAVGRVTQRNSTRRLASAKTDANRGSLCSVSARLPSGSCRLPRPWTTLIIRGSCIATSSHRT